MRTLIEMAHEVYGEHVFWTEDQLLKLKAFAELVRADEREKSKHNEEVLMNALWKACGDDAQVVEATIDSQGELK